MYLSAADRGFRLHREALAECGAAEPAAAVELWWVQRRHREFHRTELRGDRRHERMIETRAAVVALIGEDAFLRYTKTEPGRWIEPRSFRIGRTAAKAR